MEQSESQSTVAAIKQFSEASSLCSVFIDNMEPHRENQGKGDERPHGTSSTLRAKLLDFERNSNTPEERDDLITTIFRMYRPIIVVIISN